MSKKYLAALISSVLGIGCITYFMAVVYKDDQYRMLNGAIIMFAEMVILLLASIIFYSNKETKEIGQGVLLGAGITLLIGFGICSSV